MYCGESGSNVTLLNCSKINGDLSLSMYFLIDTLNDEYCSTPSISAGSLKPLIDILKSLLVEVP